MTATVKVKDGDRVRVVLEGKAFDSESGGFTIGAHPDSNFITPAACHVISIEKVAGVGDVIATVDGLDSLPPGGVVLDNEGDAWQKSRDDDLDDYDGKWQVTVGDGDLETARYVIDEYGPVVVLHIGVKS